MKKLKATDGPPSGAQGPTATGPVTPQQELSAGASAARRCCEKLGAGAGRKAQLTPMAELREAIGHAKQVQKQVLRDRRMLEKQVERGRKLLQKQVQRDRQVLEKERERQEKKAARKQAADDAKAALCMLPPREQEAIKIAMKLAARQKKDLRDADRAAKYAAMAARVAAATATAGIT